MSGEIALDTSVAVRFLNGDPDVVSRVLALPEIFLLVVVVGELLFGAENSTRPLKNLPRYLVVYRSLCGCACGKANGSYLCSDSFGFEAQRATNSYE